MTTTVDHTTTERPPIPPVTEPIRPVMGWAALGVLFALLALYVQGRWLLGGQAHHVGTGITPVPLYAKISVRSNEILFGLGSLVCFYLAVLRPKARTGQLSFNGLLWLALFFVWWQDAITNYLAPGFAWNAQFLNLGGWGANIPGWASPNPGQSTIPLVWDVGFYLFASFVLLVTASALLERARHRWPTIKLPVLLALYYVVLVVADFAMEFLWVVTGAYAYGGTIKSWTLFSGHYYQFPIYEALLAAAVFLGWTCLVHFKNEQGETFLERGLGRVTLRRGPKQFVRFLALVGGLNVAYLICYFIPINAFENHGGAWPADLQQRSYMVHGLCGPGTDVTCGKR